MLPTSGLNQSSIFEGNSLLRDMPQPAGQDALCWLTGKAQNGRDFAYPLSLDLLSKHMLFIGGIGMGKTNAIFQMLDQLRGRVRPEDLIIVFDTKGDFYKRYYRPGDVVISNDKNACGPSGPDYWNIFNELKAGFSLEEEINEITRSLFSTRIENSNQPFFPNAAKDLFAAILYHFSAEGLPANNAFLRDFLDQADAPLLRSILEKHQNLKAMVSYIADDRSPQTQGVISELQQTVREIFVGNFRQAGTLSIRNLVRSKGQKLIFIEYDLGIGNLLTPVYKLLIDLALKETLSRTQEAGNVWFIIDEFRLLPKLQHIDDGINFGRSLGAKFALGIQNIKQVFDAYGEARAYSLLSGLSTTLAFHVNDEATRDYIKGLHGKNRKKEVYMASVQSRGIVEQIRDANVVEDWDISRLKVGEAIIGNPSHQPFIMQLNRVN